VKRRERCVATADVRGAAGGCPLLAPPLEVGGGEEELLGWDVGEPRREGLELEAEVVEPEQLVRRR
jgi:hypothetical protein